LAALVAGSPAHFETAPLKYSGSRLT